MLHHTKVAEGTSTLDQTFNLSESTVHNVMKNANKIHSDVIHFISLTAMVTMRIRNPAGEKGENAFTVLGTQDKEENLFK